MLRTEAAARAGISAKTLEARIRKGWSVEDALRAPCVGVNRSRDPIIGALQDVCRVHGRRWSVVKKRLLRGRSVDEALASLREARGEGKAA
jgi:hypothetical protein